MITLAMSPIEALLKERIGLDAAAIGPAVIARAVEERRIAVGADDTLAYWNTLHASAGELQALIEAVVVPETWFFRHRESLLALARLAAQRVLGDGERLLRVLSVPCSTGEEPYSIAMALLDGGLPAARFRVDAVDISARALARAKAGLYGGNAFRGQPLDFRARHFTAAPGGYQLSETVRNQVRLLSGNLMDPGLLAAEPPYDMVFCRNLLIYFDPATQRRAVQTLRRLVRPDGMLFVGPAEASLLTREGMRSAGIPLAFAFHPEVAVPPVVPAAPRLRAVPAPAVAPAARPIARAMPVRAVAPEPRSTPPGNDSAALRAISAQADRGDVGAATAACLRFLDSHGASASGWCLLGVLHDAAGRAADAHAAYRKAVYLDPGHEEALYHLAALLDSEGDAAGAARLRQRAQRHARMSHG
ncbi:CheR family methyltransferase [Cupriavidus agavae]|uniref:Chemotaxis protein methyltransferase WspC n=1 Tax=Cupriavidus agavae TaxID=1001822 RepID=A0A4Q7RRL3_9BURK|nr:protein-glutamate O-methyltransferase CheR [Cupriavidus agavae]RZT36293.1 chemotaxis protein methyltransferase WspC [Cupriavidus agavae]